MYRRTTPGLRPKGRRVVAAVAVALGIAAAGAVDHAEAQARPAHVKVKVRHRTLVVQGTRHDDAITLRVAAARPQFLVVDVGDDGTADHRIHRDRFDDIIVYARRGSDVIRIDETAGVTLPFTDRIPTSLRGQLGADAIDGGSGAEDLNGGPGPDIVDGNRGNDRAMLGGGNDEFIWDPGDGSDTIEGHAGRDVMTFNGSDGAEVFDASANGSRLRFFRDLGNIVMDADEVEQVDLNALGGADTVTVNDLSATDVRAFNADTAAAVGTANGDGALDTIVVTGTAHHDNIAVSVAPGVVNVNGLVPAVSVAHAETTDRLTISSLGGNDSIDASALDTMQLEVLAGAGHDRVLGSRGADNLVSGAGHDVVDGNQGGDSADLEAGDDEFIWDPGDGSDRIEGRDGHDVLTFNGSDGDEIFDASANGARLRFFRNLGNIVMDTDEVEQLDLNALRGADQFTLNDLTGTDVTIVDVDLAGALGGVGGENAVDRLTVNGTDDDDTLAVSGASGSVRLDGLVNSLDVNNAEATDVLTIDGRGGTDTLDSTGLAPNTIALTFND